MTARVEVDLTGLDFAVKSAIQAGADLRPVWREFRKPIRKMQVEHIKTQTGESGAPLRSLARSTIERRLKRGGKARNFTKRGRIKKSAARRIGKVLSRKLVSKARIKTTRRSISLFARGKVAHFHQSGGKAGRGRRVKVPARPYVYVDDPLARLAFVKVSQHVAKSFEDAKTRR